MTALTCAAVTASPAADKRSSQTSIHGVVVVDRCSGHVEDHHRDIHHGYRFPALESASDSPSSRATT